MSFETPEYSYVIFPYLKTHKSIKIGEFEFKTTDNFDGLDEKQQEEIKVISSMLFLQNDFRIKSATYTIVPSIKIEYPETLQGLVKIRDFVAYCYLGPRHEFGDIFFPTENSCMIILSPGHIPYSLVYPDHHVENISPDYIQKKDARGEIIGFSGLLDFKHFFWVSKGSRIYGPKPHISLNIAQDLEHDISTCIKLRCDYGLLYNSLTQPKTKTSERFFTALKWFNSANYSSNTNSAALVDLSIAFEALLNLPANEKTDRLIDAISMLLGRISRLDIWVKQFYEARSRIVHEGNSEQNRFIATDSRKKDVGNQYQSLLSYGRQIFQLCLGTLLTGLDLSISSKLEEKFITNEERFSAICNILGNEEISIEERFKNIFSILRAIEHYRYIPESDLKIFTMINVASIAANTILKNMPDLPSDFTNLLTVFYGKRSENFIIELETISRITEMLGSNRRDLTNDVIESFSDLIKIIWDYVFMHYFWLKEKSK